MAPLSKTQTISPRTSSKWLFDCLIIYRSRASPSVTLDTDSTYSRFCPPNKNVQNARLEVLDNFKQISRIMTQNFLTHKKLETRYKNAAIPRSERERKRLEESAQ